MIPWSLLSSFDWQKNMVLGLVNMQMQLCLKHSSSVCCWQRICLEVITTTATSRITPPGECRVLIQPLTKSSFSAMWVGIIGRQLSYIHRRKFWSWWTLFPRDRPISTWCMWNSSSIGCMMKYVTENQVRNLICFLNIKSTWGGSCTTIKNLFQDNPDFLNVESMH